MYFTDSYRQCSSLSNDQCFVTSQMQTTPKAFLKKVGKIDQSQRPAPKSQHTISNMLYLSQKSPQNLRLASCTPTVGFENSRKVPLHNRFLILVLPVPTSPRITIFIFNPSSALDSIIIIKQLIVFINRIMAHISDELDFDHYELIPNEDTLRIPTPDRYAQLNSKPYNQSKENSKTEDSRAEEYKQKYEKLMTEKDNLISELNKKIEELLKQLGVQKQKISNFKTIINGIKAAIHQQNIQDQSLPSQIQNLHDNMQKLQKQQIKQQIIQGNDKKIDESQRLKQKQQQIRHLKAKLLESTQNNIATIFHTQPTQNQIILNQIHLLKDNIIQQIQSHCCHGNIHGYFHRRPGCSREDHRQIDGEIGCKHDQKIRGLIKKYEEMLEVYHLNQRYMGEIRDRQDEHFGYFSAIKAQINNSIYRVCGEYTNQRLSDLEKKIEQLNKSKEPEPKLTDMRTQLSTLTQKLQKYEKQLQKLQRQNTNLLKKSQVAQKNQGYLHQVQQQLREKDKRINQLQNTIIEHIDSKVRADSINSQQSDVEKQKINIRNLKTLVNHLKEENKHIKKKFEEIEEQNKELRKRVSSLTMASDGFQMVEIVNKDESSIKLVEDIVEVLVNAANYDQSSKCKCLELTTDCLMNLNEEYPELESILEGLGVVQKTSYLLPVSI